MITFLEDVADFLVTQLELGVEMGEPSLVVLVNALIIAGIVALALGRLRVEMRRQQWNNMTPEERRERIWQVVKEAWELAEWMLSDVKAQSPPEKRLVGAQKKRAAVAYAKRELDSMGAGYRDMTVVKDQIERVCREMKDGYARFTQVRINPS